MGFYVIEVFMFVNLRACENKLGNVMQAESELQSSDKVAPKHQQECKARISTPTSAKEGGGSCIALWKQMGVAYSTCMQDLGCI